MTFIRPLLALILLVLFVFLFLGVQRPALSPTYTSLLSTPIYAPTSAPPVTAVTLVPALSCLLPSPCTLTVTIAFASPQFAPVIYVFKFFDRCTGSTATFQGNQFTPAGFTSVSFSTVLRLPSAHSASLTALTLSPAAASAPLLFGSPTCRPR